MTQEKAHLGEVEAWRWLVARSTNWESADPKLGPSADAPTPADWEARRGATKELDEAAEGLGRASRFNRSGLDLAICKDPVGGGG